LAGSSGLSPTWLVIVAYTDLGEPPPAGLTVFEKKGQKIETQYALDEVRVFHLVEFH
jgi:hypothetical protein